jgi:hypothetical protein
MTQVARDQLLTLEQAAEVLGTGQRFTRRLVAGDVLAGAAHAHTTRSTRGLSNASPTVPIRARHRPQQVRPLTAIEVCWSASFHWHLVPPLALHWPAASSGFQRGSKHWIPSNSRARVRTRRCEHVGSADF